MRPSPRHRDDDRLLVVSGLIGAHAVLHPFSCRRLTGILSTSIKQGVFDAKEVGFGRIIDSPTEAVEMIVRSLPASVREHLKPLSR